MYHDVAVLYYLMACLVVKRTVSYPSDGCCAASPSRRRRVILAPIKVQSAKKYQALRAAHVRVGLAARNEASEAEFGG